MDSLTLNKPIFNSFYFTPANPRTKLLYPSNFSFFKLSHLIELKTSPICFSHKNPSTQQKPKPRNNSNRTFLSNPLWVSVTILKNIKGLASSQTKKWASRLQAYSDESEKTMGKYSGNYMRNGAFGLALLSITSNAKVKISPFVATLAANPTFISGLFAWFIAQSMKVFLNFFVERKWDLRVLFASGGMPSSHSALCTALTTSVAFCHGVADSLFPVCLGFSLIVMYDAIGVRRHAGMQAVVLNMIVEDLFQGHPISQRKLKELLGHTPSQVLAGALLGIFVACVCCQGCIVVT
ncbi:unnamed protein product [Dovyalis caffra]|uniref:Acid phosphatase/vanadium-dependent haloperoxidase-related protein n=1 Tax=Dovyalis caffra TaxID=77055 RepID=A0AAV1SB97_9ROSI|nr:unnamed protein product [Dovyalis caffra]